LSRRGVSLVSLAGGLASIFGPDPRLSFFFAGKLSSIDATLKAWHIEQPFAKGRQRL